MRSKRRVGEYRWASLPCSRFLFLLAIAAAAVAPPLAGQELTYPAADRDEVVDDYHGTRVADPYRWLEQLDSPRTADWLKAEKRLTADYLAGGARQEVELKLPDTRASATARRRRPCARR